MRGRSDQAARRSSALGDRSFPLPEPHLLLGLGKSTGHRTRAEATGRIAPSELVVRTDTPEHSHLLLASRLGRIFRQGKQMHTPRNRAAEVTNVLVRPALLRQTPPSYWCASVARPLSPFLPASLATPSSLGGRYVRPTSMVVTIGAALRHGPLLRLGKDRANPQTPIASPRSGRSDDSGSGDPGPGTSANS